MIQKDISISIPVLWGEDKFTKSQWGDINYLVGPNGTGKSLFAEELKKKFTGNGFNSRYLSAERLVGLEKHQEGRFGGGNLMRGFDISLLSDYKTRAENTGLSSSGIIILKERLDVRIRVEALLSDIFNKTIRLVEEGGYLKPKMQTLNSGDEYSLGESECHGLKELITLLTFLYDPAKNCIIFDEPELHLHPQYQAFFLEELNKVAGNPIEDPSKKIFFIITHSPYFIDIKTLDDLRNIIVFSQEKVATYVETLDDNDQYILKRFLPRFNTHHKQFFFSSNPVFVEGYTDQQIITLIFEKLGINIGAAGSCIIDVGGKDELGVFFRLCKALNIDCRIIADLDALFRGRLRQVISEDPRSISYIQNNGIGANTSAEIGDLEAKLSSLADILLSNEVHDSEILDLKNTLQLCTSEETHRLRVSMLLGALKLKAELRSFYQGEDLATLNLIIGRVDQLLSAFREANTFILPRGEIEHYYTKSDTNYLKVTNKDSSFHRERDYLLQIANPEIVENEYGDLVKILKQAVPVVELDLKKHMKYEVFEWIHKIQTGIARKEIISEEDVRRNTKINYILYSQIFELVKLTINTDLTFECVIGIDNSLISESPRIEFNQATNIHTFDF